MLRNIVKGKRGDYLHVIFSCFKWDKTATAPKFCRPLLANVQRDFCWVMGIDIQLITAPFFSSFTFFFFSFFFFLIKKLTLLHSSTSFSVIVSFIISNGSGSKSCLRGKRRFKSSEGNIPLQRKTVEIYFV